MAARKKQPPKSFFKKVKDVLFSKRYLKTKAAVLIGAIILAGAGVGAYFYFKNPDPVVSGTVRAPGVSYISPSKIVPDSFSISFSEPVAKLDLVGKEVTQQIQIFPNVGGTWEWDNQYRLYFKPEADWAPSTEYSIKLAKSLFDSAYKVKPLTYEMATPDFSGSVSQTEFYEDPVNVKIKRVTATLTFTHPVDIEDLKKNLKMQTAGGFTYEFSVTPADFNRKVYVVSNPVKIRAEEDFLTVSLKNVKNMYNKEGLKEPLSAQVKIPSSSTFFKVESVYSDIILNEEKENEAEQILFVDFSTAVSAEALAPYFELYSYEGSCWRIENKIRDENARVSGLDRIKELHALGFTALPLDKKASKTHTFKYKIKDPKNVCVVAHIKRGLMSEDDFMLSDAQIRTTDASRWPSSVSIAFDGSLLSFTGDKRLYVTSRGMEKIKASIARIPVNQVNHLISQTYGDFKNPSFRGYFSEEDISEIFDQKLQLNTNNPEKPNYTSVDLNPYFESKKGIFIAEVEGYRAGESYSNARDNRLVLVTNIGIIAKDNQDNSHTVFVSDFAQKQPIAGAKVDILGKNGLPVLSAVTDESGAVSFPNFSDFKREKKPIAYLVTSGSDVSFMPIDKSDRRLDYSRFDVEGVYSGSHSETLKGYVFSDRGTYRPSEDAYFGIIVKDNDLKAPKGNVMKINVFDSHGDNVYEKKMMLPESGLMDVKYSVPATARTGSYTIYVAAEKKNRYFDTIGSTSFDVQEFVPETMRIQSKFAGAVPKGWVRASELKAIVSLENLYGNPAADNEVRAEVNLIPSNFYFTQYADYVFRDPLRDSAIKVMSVSEKLPSQQTDKRGIAEFTVDLKQYVSGTYSLQFRADGIEAVGCRSVSTQTSALVSPLEYLVGWKKDGDLGFINKAADRSVHFIAVEPTLELRALNELTFNVYEKKYVSTLVKQPNGMYKYQSVENVAQVSSDVKKLPQGGLTYKLDTNTPGQFYIEVVGEQGRLLAHVDYTVAGAKNLTYSLEKNAELAVKLNKTEYNHGEKIEMQITAPYTGYGLITIEKDSVVAHKWFKAQTLSSAQSIVLPESVEGNAYINVAFVRDLASDEIFMSPLTYAVVPFSINKEKRTVKIDLKTPKLVKPGEELVIKYKTSKPSKIIVWGVNEGILTYGKYRTPAPLLAFMPKQALRVATYQIMDLILPEARLLKNKASIGGDSEAEEAIAKNLNPFARKVDKPVAFWSGILEATTGEKTYTYTVPENFNGQMRIMAVAVNDTSFGVTQKTSFVRGDFAMTLSAPFNVIPGDVFDVGVSVANMVEGSGMLPVRVVLEASDKLEVIGAVEETVSLDENASAPVRFKVRAKESLGNATLVFKADSGDHRSKMTLPIGIRPNMLFETDVKSEYVKKEITLEKFTLDMYDEFRKKQIVASTSPLVLASGIVKYLDKYPYGCTEQTVSRSFPMIALLFNHPDLVKEINVYDLFDITLSKLKRRQTSAGGFSAYDGGSYEHDFASVYAYHFLTYAAGRDFDVPRDMMKRAAAYAKELASKVSEYESDNELAAYAIYVLTLNGEITTNYLINLESRLNKTGKEWKKSLTASYVAASYQLLKDANKASEFIGKYELGKNTLKDAQHLYLMASHFSKEFEKVRAKGIEILMAPLKQGLLNSIYSSYALLALNAYPYSGEADKQISFSTGQAGYDTFATLDFGGLKENDAVKISSPAPFYYTVVQQGFRKNPPKENMFAGVEIIKEIRNDKGEKITEGILGDEVTVTLRLKSNNKKTINDVAIVDLTPGCFELIPSTQSNSSFVDYQELREDRAIIYLSVSPDLTDVSYKAKIIAKGDFVLPPVNATALYDSDIKAHTKAGRFTVHE
ncbi:MAG: hypothetical protein LBU87_01655 [Lactobacillales bacterium]|nr:hypothetical protein [Lactobacillales bacterium]